MTLNELPETQEQSSQGFDYNTLNDVTRTVVQQKASEIRSLVRRTSQNIIETGLKLTEVKQHLGHGHFRNWIKSEFDWSVPTVNRFMQASEQFKCLNLTHLNVSPSALYILASPSTSEKVRQEALELADRGQKISCASVKAIVARHRPVRFEKTATVAVGTPASTIGQHSSIPASQQAQLTQLTEQNSSTSDEDVGCGAGSNLEEKNIEQSKERLQGNLHLQGTATAAEDSNLAQLDLVGERSLVTILSWKEGNNCYWQDETGKFLEGEIAEIRDNKALIDFLDLRPPEKLKLLPLADLKHPDFYHTIDGTQQLEKKNEAVASSEAPETELGREISVEKAVSEALITSLDSSNYSNAQMQNISLNQQKVQQLGGQRASSARTPDEAVVFEPPELIQAAAVVCSNAHYLAKIFRNEQVDTVTAAFAPRLNPSHLINHLSKEQIQSFVRVLAPHIPLSILEQELNERKHSSHSKGVRQAQES